LSYFFLVKEMVECAGCDLTKLQIQNACLATVSQFGAGLTYFRFFIATFGSGLPSEDCEWSTTDLRMGTKEASKKNINMVRREKKTFFLSQNEIVKSDVRRNAIQ
jgi:hypothetical protein